MSATVCVERATSDKLSGPDWAMNIEICDIINNDPGQARNAVRTLKKRLGSKNPKRQLLALFVLETLTKNCGDTVFQHIVEGDLLREMVKIVKKKADLNVREKILVLINTWQEALGGSRGQYPQYYAAYNELQSVGVDFPPHEENSIAMFTSPQTQPVGQPASTDSTSTYEEAVAFQASLQSDPSGLDLEEIQTASGVANVLMEMLNFLDPQNNEGVQGEVIIDLVDQCRAYQKRVIVLVDNALDEELMMKGLALNDTLQHVLSHYADIAKGVCIPKVVATQNPSAPLVNVSREDKDEYELEDDFSKLARRRRDRRGRKTASDKTVPEHVMPILPPSSRRNTLHGQGERVQSDQGQKNASDEIAPERVMPIPPSSRRNSLQGQGKRVQSDQGQKTASDKTASDCVMPILPSPSSSRDTLQGKGQRALSVQGQKTANDKTASDCVMPILPSPSSRDTLQGKGQRAQSDQGQKTASDKTASDSVMPILPSPSSTRNTLKGQGQKAQSDQMEPIGESPILPPLPSRKPKLPAYGTIEYLYATLDNLSDDLQLPPRTSEAYKSPSHVPINGKNTDSNIPSNGAPSDDFINPTASMFSEKQPAYKEPAPTTNTYPLPPAPWETPEFIPPPPSKHSQRKQFFKQQHVGSSHSSSGSGSSYDSLVEQANNLSINSSTPKKQENSEDALFRDLVDFAKSKSSSSSNPNRSHQK
ncbi:uncharacterized protein LOC141671363 [Apium graveolens]|uniref:uncharacterized protein LOC141671363 n=1 Tax=Apium graveolens TaxID=4045 RepID=UPI003D79CCA1